MSKRNLLPLLALPLLLTGCETASSSSSSPSSSASSSTSSSSPFVPPNDVKSYLQYLASERNYTFTVETSDRSYLMTYYFTENVVGSTSLDSPEYTSLLIQDEEGVYPLNYYEGSLVSGEYLTDDNGDRYQDVWEISSTLHGREEDFLASLPSGETSYTIESKAYRIAFLEMLGYDSTTILDFSDIQASVEGNSLVLSFTLEDEDLFLTVQDLRTTTVPLYEEFVAEGGTAYEPAVALTETRRLFQTDQMIISQSASGYTLRELLHPNYFFTSMSDAMFSGFVAIDRPEDDLVGVYSAIGTGSFDADSTEGVTGVQISTSSPIWDVPDMTQFYRYPSALLLWNNLQFLSEGLDESFATIVPQPKGVAYHTMESNILLDFVTNFSIDQSYPLTEYLPVSLSLDIALDEEDKTSVVELYYLYYYSPDGSQINAGYLHYSISGFGNTSIPRLDELIA